MKSTVFALFQEMNYNTLKFTYAQNDLDLNDIKDRKLSRRCKKTIALIKDSGQAIYYSAMPMDILK